MWPNPQSPVNLVTFTKEILKEVETWFFLCSFSGFTLVFEHNWSFHSFMHSMACYQIRTRWDHQVGKYWFSFGETDSCKANTTDVNYIIFVRACNFSKINCMTCTVWSRKIKWDQFKLCWWRFRCYKFM